MGIGVLSWPRPIEVLRESRDAERFLTAVEASKLRGDWVDPTLGRTRLAEWLDAWLDSVRPTLEPKTVLGYRSLIRSRIVPALGHARLAALQPSDLQTWIAAMQDAGLWASRIRQAHVVLAEEGKKIQREITRGPDLDPNSGVVLCRRQRWPLTRRAASA